MEARVTQPLALPVRSYRVYPPPGQDYDDHQYGHVSDVVELTAANTAVVAIDLWNLGADGLPLIPDLGKYWEYNYLGGHGVAKRASAIMVERIAPVLRAARAAGIAIVHSEPEAVAARYPAATRPVPDPAARRPEGSHWPPAEFRSQLAHEHYTRTFGEGYAAAWPRIRQVLDVAEGVQPEPTDCIITQSEPLEAFLAERKILNLVYVGFLLNFCLLQKPGGILHMQHRYRTILLRDCTAASEVAWSADAGLMTKAFIHWLEIGGTVTATGSDFLRLMRVAV